MLTELKIRDLALIEDLELDLGSGLNVLTGETGAGKSLIVTSLELLLGERPRGGPGAWVRRGARRARVEARFVIEEGPTATALEAFLDGAAPELAAEFREAADVGEAGRELILGRTLEAVGRTRAHVNGQAVTQKMLRDVGAQLFEIHGQNTHQRLLDPVHQVELLDAFGDLGALREAYLEERLAWAAYEREVSAREERLAEREGRLELIGFHADELCELDVRPGERALLSDERERLRHGGSLCREVSGWAGALEGSNQGGGDDGGGAIDLLRRVEQSLSPWAERIEALRGLDEDLREARLRAEEVLRKLGSLAGEFEADPHRLEELETRLAAIDSACNKHRCSAEELAERLELLTRERLELESAPGELDGARARAKAALGRTLKLAGRLTRGRRAAGEPLGEALVPRLASLGLGNARFGLELEPRAPKDRPTERLGLQGADRVEFLLAANPGEPLQPLRQVASGGEAARVLLALRGALAGFERRRTLVFDEIDSGVGGRLGPELGEHLRGLSQHHQVLSITHLPAIAAAADQHLRVAKCTEGGRTRTSVEELVGKSRVKEIAEMISGGGGARTALAEARRLLAGVA